MSVYGDPDPEHFPQELWARAKHVCTLIKDAGGRAFLVGGCVRDLIIGIPPKDVDIEVFGLHADHVQRIIGQHYGLNLVGKSFGVIKLKSENIDIGLPRRESKSGRGHQGFYVDSDPKMSYEEAASRRDFTMNAISWDPLTNELIDPFNGQSDLINRMLRHTTNKFSEDPLRVLRGMQFAARFRMRVAPDTIKLCQSIEPEDLSRERIFDEWRKLIVQGVEPGIGLRFLRDSGWVRYFPELNALIDCEQDAEWHPEGDVWTHTLLCMDAFAREKTNDEWENLIVGFAVLCHDIGKPDTSVKDKDGHIRSHSHDVVGAEITETYLHKLTSHKDLIDAVIPLVKYHMHPLELYRNKASDAAVRRLARRVGRIDRLVRVDSADRQGRGEFYDKPSPQGQWLLERAEALAVMDAAPKPIILGRHLIDEGLEPGVQFKVILETCFDAQTDGAFNDIDSGINYLRELLKKM